MRAQNLDHLKVVYVNDVENGEFIRTRKEKNQKWNDKISKRGNGIIPNDIKNNVQARIVRNTYTGTNEIKEETMNGPKILEIMKEDKKIDSYGEYEATENKENRKYSNDPRSNDLSRTKGEIMESHSKNLKKIDEQKSETGDNVRTAGVDKIYFNNLENEKMSDGKEPTYKGIMDIDESDIGDIDNRHTHVKKMSGRKVTWADLVRGNTKKVTNARNNLIKLK